jgi:hypothetical protein
MSNTRRSASATAAAKPVAHEGPGEQRKMRVVIMENGVRRTLFVTKDEFDELVSRQTVAFDAGDTPDELMPAIEALARDGDD